MFIKPKHMKILLNFLVKDLNLFLDTSEPGNCYSELPTFSTIYPENQPDEQSWVKEFKVGSQNGKIVTHF